MGDASANTRRQRAAAASPEKTPAARSAALVLLLGVVVAAAIVAAAPSSSHAGPAVQVDTWEGRLVRDRQVLRALASKRLSQGSLLAQTRDAQAQRWRGVSVRLATIYKSGGHPSVDEVIVSGDSVGEVAAHASAIAAVTQQDRRALREYVALGRRAERIEQRIVQLDGQITVAKRRVLRAQRELQEARLRLKAAQERAERLRRKARSPLETPVGAVSVAQVLAGEDPQVATAPVGFAQTGVASMYADSFSGERTANGDIYNPNALTAAHLTLPLGTWVLVQGPGGSAMVRINDRGPYVGGRIIDLSRAAAVAVGLNGLGTVTVTVA